MIGLLCGSQRFFPLLQCVSNRPDARLDFLRRARFVTNALFAFQHAGGGAVVLPLPFLQPLPRVFQLRLHDGRVFLQFNGFPLQALPFFRLLLRDFQTLLRAVLCLRIIRELFCLQARGIPLPEQHVFALQRALRCGGRFVLRFPRFLIRPSSLNKAFPGATVALADAGVGMMDAAADRAGLAVGQALGKLRCGVAEIFFRTLHLLLLPHLRGFPSLFPLFFQRFTLGVNPLQLLCQLFHLLFFLTCGRPFVAPALQLRKPGTVLLVQPAHFLAQSTQPLRIAPDLLPQLIEGTLRGGQQTQRGFLCFFRGS